MALHLHIDPFSGIAGDMFLGAMVDLGVPIIAITDALQPLAVERGYEITTNRVQRHGIGAVDLKVNVHQHPNSTHGHHHDHSGEHTHSHSHDDHHHHTGYREIMAMVEQLDVSKRGKERASRVVTLLAEAEARVHAKPIEEIHFHEVGAVDSIVDMLGSIIALEILDIASVSCGPLPISSGFVRCAHGLMPVPAPATAYLMRDMPTVGVPRRGELVTPTGAALVAGICDQYAPPPAMVMNEIGYGAGDREDPDVPNLLRLMLGRVEVKPHPLKTHTHLEAASKN